MRDPSTSTERNCERSSQHSSGVPRDQAPRHGRCILYVARVPRARAGRAISQAVDLHRTRRRAQIGGRLLHDRAGRRAAARRSRVLGRHPRALQRLPTSRESGGARRGERDALRMQLPWLELRARRTVAGGATDPRKTNSSPEELPSAAILERAMAGLHLRRPRRPGTGAGTRARRPSNPTSAIIIRRNSISCSRPRKCGARLEMPGREFHGGLSLEPAAREDLAFGNANQTL